MFRASCTAITENTAPGEVAQDLPTELGATLRAITIGSRLALADERAGIMADFARRIAAACMTADPRQLAGILRALKAERRARLAIASRNKTRERAEQRQA